ncbi:hypothetical protein BKA56DRAFT_570223 [Ilyonectria sp. MPI-CAGE-AT-0026]|nr:hypothetical protein BKA56DRAFT_570223 [Ilyonectria sp. MPI-CAGE-AT-0026]
MARPIGSTMARSTLLHIGMGWFAPGLGLVPPQSGQTCPDIPGFSSTKGIQTQTPYCQVYDNTTESGVIAAKRRSWAGSREKINVASRTA